MNPLDLLAAIILILVTIFIIFPIVGAAIWSDENYRNTLILGGSLLTTISLVIWAIFRLFV